jgi:hypothetical protein
MGCTSCRLIYLYVKFEVLQTPRRLLVVHALTHTDTRAMPICCRPAPSPATFEILIVHTVPSTAAVYRDASSPLHRAATTPSPAPQ